MLHEHGADRCCLRGESGRRQMWIRESATGNGYEGIGIQEARRKIHDKFLDRNLDLNGETSSHDQIINEVFGMDEYEQEATK